MKEFIYFLTRCPSQRADARCDGQLAGIVAETAKQQADTGGQAAVPVTMPVKRVQACLLCSEANGLAPNVSQSDCLPDCMFSNSYCAFAARVLFGGLKLDGS